MGNDFAKRSSGNCFPLLYEFISKRKWSFRFINLATRCIRDIYILETDHQLDNDTQNNGICPITNYKWYMNGKFKQLHITIPHADHYSFNTEALHYMKHGIYYISHEKLISINRDGFPMIKRGNFVGFWYHSVSTTAGYETSCAI